MPASPDKKWPHAPPHWTFEPGIYMVTAGTRYKAPLLGTPARLNLMQDLLRATTHEFGWELQAWAILSNHYHFIARSPTDGACTLARMLGKMHMLSAKELNRQDNTPGRKVWFQFWESQITFQTSYLARLRYVHYNPAHHGVVDDAMDYPWCSARWFDRCAPAAFVETVRGMKTDRVQVMDEF